MLQNSYFLAKIGAGTAENEQHFADIWALPATSPGAGRSDRGQLSCLVTALEAAPLHVLSCGHVLTFQPEMRGRQTAPPGVGARFWCGGALVYFSRFTTSAFQE